MIFLGDIHGNFNVLVSFIRRKETNKHINLIQVGDFGAGFNPDFTADLSYINDLFEENNATLYVIRGNHDNPNFFNGDYIYSNVKLLPDYTVLNIEGKNILFVGGAISIDRVYRKENINWWFNEYFTLDIDKLTQIEKKIDIIVTHSAPNIAPPVDFNDLVRHYSKSDHKLLNELIDERSRIFEMYKLLKTKHNPTHWFYGHFHSSNIFRYETTDFVLLNIDQFYEL